MPARNRLPVAIIIPTLLVLVALGLFWALTSPQSAQGATRTVTSTADGGPGSLRLAIADAASGDTINIPAGVYTLTQGTELLIDKSLTLDGAGSVDTINQAAENPEAANSRVFNVRKGAVSLSDLTIRHGNRAGVYNIATLTMSFSTVNGNLGGGIHNVGTLTLNNSTVSNNMSDRRGGGVFNQPPLLASPSAAD